MESRPTRSFGLLLLDGGVLREARAAGNGAAGLKRVQPIHWRRRPDQFGDRELAFRQRRHALLDAFEQGPHVAYGAHGILPAKPDIAQRTLRAFLGSARQHLSSWVSGMLTELASLLGEVILVD